MGVFTDQLNKVISSKGGVFSGQLEPEVNTKMAKLQAEQALYDKAAKDANSPFGLFKEAFSPPTLGKAILDTGANIGQGIARSVGSAGTTFGNLPTQIVNKVTRTSENVNPLPFDKSIPTDQNPFTRALFGGKPIETVQERTKNLQSTLSPYIGQTGAKYSAAPLVLGGILMDLSGFKGGKAVDVAKGEVPEAFLKLLAKKSDPLVLENTLRAVKVDEANAKALASKLANVSDINEVKNILIEHQPVASPNTYSAELPKVQISDEGIPMARKSVPFLPPLTVNAPKPTIVKPAEIPTPTGIIGLTKQNFSPLKYVDEDTANVFRQYNADTIKAKELANQTASSVKIPNDGMDTINNYQSGQSNPQIKQVFDQLFNEANQRGIQVPYRQNYVPQVYKGSYSDVQKSIAKYLTDNGITDEAAQNYINGIQSLPEEAAKRLKLSPTFEKERVFPDYKTAMKYGLKPKYQTVSELAAHYRGELEKVIANSKLLETLKKKGQIKPADSQFTPSNWTLVNSEFSGPRLYKAPVNVAKVINNMFANPNKGLFGTIAQKVGAASGMAQNIVLSAGAPGTNVNFFALGQLNKELHSGNVKAAKAFLQTNSKSSTVKYFQAHKQALADMAEQGIDVTSRMGSFGKDTFMGLAKDKEFTKALGFGIDKVFGEKTFQGFMPMMQVQLFEDVAKSAIKKGLTPEEAKKLSGDIVKKNFGINSDDFARSQITRDTLKAVFFAPRFRESVINSLSNTGKAGIDFIWQLGGARGKIDPTLSRNRRLLAGMILSYGIYNVINKKLNGKYMWDNPDNRKFALRIPLSNGEVTYAEFMPSYLAFARNMASGALSAVKGDFKSAFQQFGSVFSIPIKLTSEVIGNRDYFGNSIYKETDSTLEKSKKVALYLGLNLNHPYIKEVVNQIQDKKPLYQSIVVGLELPLKFSSKDKEEANKIFDIMDQQNKDRADMTKLSEKEYNRLKALPKEEANKAASEIYKTNPDLYSKIRDRAEADKMGLTDNEKYIKMLDVNHRAQYIFEKVSEMKTKEEKNAYIADLVNKKIVTKDTYAELSKLIQNK